MLHHFAKAFDSPLVNLVVGSEANSSLLVVACRLEPQING